MKRICVKYGGNAMQDPELQRAVVKAIISIKESQNEVVLVHGGGPFIAQQLEQAGIDSEFVDGHRKTSPEAMVHVEMALKGKVNGQLVSLFNQFNSLALGISGKDVRTILVEERLHELREADGSTRRVSLGRVGDVKEVNTRFLESLLSQGITPVIACLGTDVEGNDYNVNADMVAGHVAGALKVDILVMMTDIDGLRKDVKKAETLIPELNIRQAEDLFGSSIQGGMIPKVDACIRALQKGAGEAVILNGTQPEQLIQKLIQHKHVGTRIIP
jgi:acetylglutamate kinase